MSSNIEPQPATLSTSIDVVPPDQQSQQPQSEGPNATNDRQRYSYGISSLQMRYDPILIVFSILIFAGGIVGYTLKESAISLIAGTAFALLLLGATYIEGARRNPYPLLVILLLLLGLMISRYVENWKFMPSGFIALLTGLMFMRHAYLFKRRWDQEKFEPLSS